VSFFNFIFNFYNKYKELILFNRNIIISAIITAVVDIYIVTYASWIYPNNYFIISFLSLIADFAIYNFTFIMLFFKDNRHRYKNKDGTKNRQKIRQDSLKLLTTLGLSEISYLSTKFASTYLIFTYIKIIPSQVSLITTILSWIIYIVTANIMIKRTKLF
jgi:hypothetical protein